MSNPPLNHLGSGIEIVTISFEAIHPPIIAAEAFTARQVAEMEAQGLIANAQSQAAVKHATANAKATEILDTARGQAADITGQARTESTLFLAAVDQSFCRTRCLRTRNPSRQTA